MDRTHKEAVHLGEKVTLAMLEQYYYWVGMASSVKWGSQEMLRLPGSQEDERYGTMTFSTSAPPFWPRPDGRVQSAGIPSKN